MTKGVVMVVALMAWAGMTMQASAQGAAVGSDEDAGQQLASTGDCSTAATPAIKQHCETAAANFRAQIPDAVANGTCASLPQVYQADCDTRRKAFEAAKSKADCDKLTEEDREKCAAKFETSEPQNEGDTNNVQSLSLGDFGFGLGLGLTYGGDPDIVDAQVIGGVVRVQEERKHTRGAWVETHLIMFERGWFAVGPFVAARINGDDLLDGLGGGLMLLGSRGSGTNLSFNVGIGYVSVPVRRLGDGIEEGVALPEGETQVRFKKSDDSRPMLLFSFNFLAEQDGVSVGERGQGSGGKKK